MLQIRQRMLGDDANHYNFHNSEEYKHKESLMELKHKKDSEKDIEEKLSKMQEKIKWSRPISKLLTTAERFKFLYLEIDIGEDNMFSKHVGKESTEAEKQQKRISSKLQCLYLKDYQIPNQPSYEGISLSPKAVDDTEPMVIPLNNVKLAKLIMDSIIYF